MYDVIVIGTGIGGLTAAGLLAGVAGKKVLLLEKHTEPGGLTHVFRRDGAAWDVGLHYVGEVGPGTPGRALFDYLSGGELKWNRMPEALERFIYPGMDFAVPSEPARYQQKLIEAFPDEARAIRRYFRDIRRVVRWTMLGFMRGMVPRAVEPVLRLLQRLTATKATQTTQAYLEAHFSSPELRALLASQWGDYGLPPSRSAFAIHAQIVSHYLHGAWFPDGGAGRIVRTFEQGIERQGGSIRVAQEVLEILLEDGRAVGVRVMDSRGPQAQERVYRAAHVISNVGAQLTYQQLLPTTGAVGQATADVRALMARLGSGYSAVTLYLRLQQSARTLGVKGENVWVNTDLNHEDIEGQTRGVLQGAPRSIYVSFPSLKSGDDKFHTAEVIAFVDDRAFEAWRGSAKGQRGTDYAALKARISAGLLALAETAIPGLRGLVAYAELATPLTVEHYTAHPGGRFYGLPASPERYRSPLLGPRTPVAGLYLAGQDAACLGILGAMWGGVGAACQVLGARGYPMIQAALKAASRAGARQTPPAAAEQAPLPKEKRHAVLTAKQRLTPSIWQVEFQMQGAGELAAYAAGQFARLRVGPNEWRDYSIASLQGATVRLLISTRTGGQGSGFIENATLGTRTQIELPLGQYTLLPNAHRQVFIATGTGIAPFLAMFAALEQQERLSAATLFFGSPTCEQDISRHLEPLPGTVVRCISREQAPAGGFTGRVTQALERFAFNPDTTDFYVCGSSAMVADCQALLQKRGARQVLVEAF